MCSLMREHDTTVYNIAKGIKLETNKDSGSSGPFSRNTEERGTG